MKLQKAALREPPVHVMLLDHSGTIIDVIAKGNDTKRDDNLADGQYTVGESYLDHCPDAQRVEVRSLLKHKRSLISYVFQSRLLKPARWYVAVGVPIGGDSVGHEAGGALVMHIDITESIAEVTENYGAPQNFQMPVTLNPDLIQDTIAKALAKQFGPKPSVGPKIPRPTTDIDSLSPRQREVLLLMAAGKSNLEIAAELSCSLNTVKRHVTAVLQKLHLPNRTRAAMLVSQLKLTPTGSGRSGA